MVKRLKLHVSVDVTGSTKKRHRNKYLNHVFWEEVKESTDSVN